MRKRSTIIRLVFLPIALAIVIASPAPAGPAPRQMAEVHAEAAVLPAPGPDSAKAAGRRSESVDLRDSASLVLVGTMLLGLAAAVRRTA
jgi:hypothetical protein